MGDVTQILNAIEGETNVLQTDWYRSIAIADIANPKNPKVLWFEKDSREGFNRTALLSSKICVFGPRTYAAIIVLSN